VPGADDVFGEVRAAADFDGDGFGDPAVAATGENGSAGGDEGAVRSFGALPPARPRVRLWRRFDRDPCRTPATRARQTVMWPYVPAFTERLRPMLRSEAEAVAGPLTPR
jgi:hypothetical protein